MREDFDLLRQYVKDGSHEAFGQLVERHCNLVWSAAYRILGDADLARDVAQTTFATLARKGGRLPRSVVVAGWLYQAARLSAAMMARTDSRRIEREKQAMQFQENSQTDPDHTKAVEELQPLLDDALGELDEADRNAIVLRFLSGRSLAEVGAALGGSEDAARMRISRALDKLRVSFRRRGVEVSGGIIGAALGSAASQTAPPALAATLAAGALTGASLAPALSLLTLMNTKIIIGLAAASMAGGLVWQHHQLQETQADNAALKRQLTNQAAPSPAVPVDSVDAEELKRLRDEHLELMRLRGQYAQLLNRPVPAQPGKPRGAQPVQAPADDSKESPETERLIATRVQALKALGMMGRLWANDHADTMPTNKSQMVGVLNMGHWPPEASLDHFEFLDHPRPVSEGEHILILMRDQPIQLHDGRWERHYLFVDGMVTPVFSVDGDFDTFEAAHTAIPDSVKPSAPTLQAAPGNSR